MKDLFAFPIVVKKVANAAKVPSKLYATFLAVLLARLNGFTFVAFHFLNCMSVNLMILFYVALI